MKTALITPRRLGWTALAAVVAAGAIASVQPGNQQAAASGTPSVVKAKAPQQQAPAAVRTAPIPMAAGETPGTPCEIGDLGRREPRIETITVQPVVTQFKAQNIATGTNRSDKFTLKQTNVVKTIVETEITNKTTFKTGKIFDLITEAQNETTVRFKWVDERTDTTEETQEVTWNFPQPGYYGIYKGVRTLTGTLNSLNCSLVTKEDGTSRREWVKRYEAPYQVFGAPEEGAVRCQDSAPATSVRRAAQIQLGCFDSGSAAAVKPAIKPVKPATRQIWPAKPRAVTGAARNRALAAAAVTCEAGFYRIVTRNGLVLQAAGAANGTPVTFAGATGDNNQQWQLCTSSVVGGFTQYVFIHRGSGKCVQAQADKAESDRTEIQLQPCSGRPEQLTYVYRDVSSSTAIGVQIVSNNFMWASNGLFEGESLRQDSVGNQDGSGTFFLEKVS